MEEVNIKDFLNYLKKYFILIITVAVLLVSATFVYDKTIKEPLYTTYTTIVLVQDGSVNLNTKSEAISQSDITLNQNLVSTYSQIIKSKLVLKQVIQNLDLNYTVKQLSRFISVEALEDTEILKISVTNEDPERAAKIANDIADVFSAEIKKIYKLNNVSVIDTAQASYEISNDTLKRDLAIVLLMSTFGIAAIVFIKYYFDDTVKLNEALEQELGMPVVCEVPHDFNNSDLIVEDRPNALTSESIRTLRTNLQFSSVDKELKTILVTSSLPGEGKSFISSNLAISFAQAGKKVLLIDCDLRKGRQHNIFGLPNKKGLSNLLIGDAGKVKDYIHKTKVKNLHVVTRGVCPPNPSELLNSKKNRTFIEKVCSSYDLVIIDGAPCNGLSDSLILSSLVDKVILICKENYTPKTNLITAKKDIENVGGNVLGCVVNNMDTNNKHNGKYYYYYEEEE